MTGSSPEISQELLQQITRLREMMLNVHYFNEAHWLDIAMVAPSSCRSVSGRMGVVGAKAVAREFGFTRVAEWIGARVLEGNPAPELPVRV
jgi:hypothetical protein